MSSLLLASFTFREAARKKTLLGAMALTLCFLGLFALGSYFAFQDLYRQTQLPPGLARFAASQILLAGLYITNFLGGLLAVFASAGTISGEVEQGTLHAIVPKPLGRWEIVLGKWLGFALMILLYIWATSAVLIGIVYSFGGYFPPSALESLLLMAFQALLLLSLSVLGSTFLSTLTNGIVVLILYAIALIGGMVEQLGALLRNATMVSIGIITSLLIPSDTLWKLASHWLQQGVAPLAGLGPFSVLNPPSLWMVLYAFLYTAVALGAALWVFQRRDL